MANGRRGFFRDIILRLDRRAAEQMEADVQDALDKAGKSGAEKLEEAMREGGNKAAWQLRRILTESYNQTIAEARVKFAKGLIDQREFDRLRAEAAKTFDEGLIKGMDRLRAEGNLTERQFRSLAGSLKTVGKEGPKQLGLVQQALEKVRAVALSVGGALAALFALNRIRAFISESTKLAARYETAGVMLRRVGENAGYTAEQLDYVERALQKTGISMLRSREVATSLISANIDLARATDLARLAQDAAVIANTNSSEAFDRLVQGISSGNVQILRNLGLAVNFQQAYQRAARQVGKAVSELTEYERVQARVNAVMEAGAGIAGTYEAALDTAGKQAGSNARLLEDLRIKLGQVFLPSFRDAVFRYADALKGANDALDRLTESDIETWGRRVAAVIDALVWVVRQLAKAVSGLVMLFDDLADAIVGLVHGGLSILQRVLAGAADGFALFLDAAAKIDEFFGKSEGAQRAREQAAAIREWADAMRDAAGISREAARTSFQEVAAPRRRSRGRTVAEISLERTGQTTETGPSPEERQRALEAELRALERGHKLGVLTAEERVRALEIEREIVRLMQDGTLALEDRITLAQQLQALQEITPQVEPPQMADTMGVLSTLAPIPLGPIRDARAEVDALAQRWLEVNADMVGAAERAAMGITGAFQDAFSILIQDFGDVGEAAEAMARGVAGALVGGVADYASSKVSENVALAIEATARALAAASNPFTASQAPGFWAAAKTHALAAAKWAVLAGAAGAGQAAIAGGGRGGLSGGIPTGARDPTGRLLEERRGPEVHIYIDPLDPYRPAWQEAVYAANRMATERFGTGATVHVHPMGGRR